MKKVTIINAFILKKIILDKTIFKFFLFWKINRKIENNLAQMQAHNAFHICTDNKKIVKRVKFEAVILK